LEQMRLKDKVAIITGGGSGIGKAAALAFAREGAKVAVADISPERADETVADIVKQGGEALGMKVDVRQAEEVEKLVSETAAKFGKLDVMFNNAGIFDGNPLVHAFSEELWDAVMDTNAKGVFLGCKYAIPEMLKQGKGKIINTASVCGFGGRSAGPAYTASKHAIIGITKQVAAWYGSMGVNANCICPSVVRTKMTEELLQSPEIEETSLRATPLGRFAQPEEIVPLLVYLASDESDYVTGAAVTIDGGWTANI